MDVETGAPMDKREALDEQVTRNVSLDAAHPGMRATGGDGASDRVRDAGPESKMWRRGLLKKALGATAAAALLAVAKEATPAEATSRTTLVGGSTSTGNFGIAAAVDVFDPATLLPNVAGLGFGVIGTFGSPGYAPPFNAGVLGQGSGAFFGVIGLSENNPGVWGQSTNGPGVVGQSSSSSQPAVRGSGQVIGVLGTASGSGTAMMGSAVNGIGLLGTSTNGVGLLGSTSSTNNVGLFGSADAPGALGSIGLVGRSAAGTGVVGQGATAARFDGPVVVNGSFTVSGGPKSAAVRHPDGEYRRMYCQESPEPWFEDFGKGTLANGRATIRLDPEFAAVVQTNDYAVFPVPNGDCKGLYVTSQTPASFEVRELQGGTSSVPFSFRIVARRRDEVGKRLERVTLKSGKLGEPLKLPDLPPQAAIPDLPERPRQSEPGGGEGPKPR